MSALQATQADGYYNPPDWNPRDHGSREKYHRSKGKNQYEQKGVIRFEMMYDSRCLGCERFIGRGTRFNALKQRSGKYYTTTIWSFHMKCASCPQKFVIRTDPENRDYEFVSGIKRMAKTRLKTARDELLEIEEERERKSKDAFYRLAKEKEDKERASRKRTRLERLSEVSERRSRDPASVNASLRKRFREEKKLFKNMEDRRESLGWDKSIRLLPVSGEDVLISRHVKFKSGKNEASLGRAKARAEIRNRSIFGSNSTLDSERTKAIDAMEKARRRKIRPKNFSVLGDSKTTTKSVKKKSKTLLQSSVPKIRLIPKKRRKK